MRIPGQNLLERMAPRERMIVVVGLFAGAALLIWALGIDPLFSQADSLNLQAKRKGDNAKELAQVLGRYQAAASRMNQAAVPRGSARDFSLLSFLEGLASRSGVKSNIKAMRPTTTDVAQGVREYAVEVQLSGIRIEPMVTLLTDVEKSPDGLRVRRLYVKRRFADPNLLDVTFTVARYEEM